jgi:Mg/Co/Ni transporter MgtE
MTIGRHQSEDEPIIEVTETVSIEDERVADLMSHTIDIPALAAAITKQKAADAADTLEDLADDEAAELIGLMEDQAAADALAEMEVPLAVTIIEDLSEDDHTNYAATLLALLAPDDAASIIRGLDLKYIEPLFVSMPVGYARKLRQLCDYEEDFRRNDNYRSSRCVTRKRTSRTCTRPTGYR